MYVLALGPFCKILKKILRAGPELWGCAIFRPQMAYLSWTIFFGTNYYCYFHMCLLALFIVQNFKKFLRWVQSYEDVPFLGPKYPNLSRAKFFGTNHYYYFHLLQQKSQHFSKDTLQSYYDLFQVNWLIQT